MRRILAALAAAALALAGLLAVAPTAHTAEVADVGFVGPAYTGSTTAPTGQKPQSKLWIAGGIWWGALFDKASRDFHIFRYDWGSNTWADTGVLVDERTNMYLDTLWDGEHLYVVSAGQNGGNVLHKPRLLRFSYDATTSTWQRDAGFPIDPGGMRGGIKAAVIDKDSTGVLWLTYFAGSRIWVTHSTGDDATWVPSYQLPVPDGASSTGNDDLAAVVAFDGDKVGILWSNQRDETMYWAWHQDGADDRAWTLQVAYRQPEGADDHINLKSVVADPAGRVFAVAKTSMDHAADPLFNLLTLGLDDTWSATKIWDKADESTRAIVQIDIEHREVYAFAAAPCCSGGTIYVKKSPMDNPHFAPGLGTPFIHSAAHPEANNPTSTKQHVTSATGLLVLASDDETRQYLYNRMELGRPADTTPPETTIVSGPASPSTPTATFEFTSSEPGSAFSCSLDGGVATPCSSPTTYPDLPDGAHVFTVVATDPAGNADPSPAAYSWQVSATVPLFADDFSSGGFAAGGWKVATGANGVAEVEPGAVRPGDPGARLTSTSNPGSTASLLKQLVAQPTLTVAWDSHVADARSGQTFALFKLYAANGRVLSLDRAGSGDLSVRDVGATIPAGAKLSLGQVARVQVSVVQDGADDRVTLMVDGTTVLTSHVDLGSGAFTAFRLGDDSVRRTLDYRVDDVTVSN